MNNHYAFASVYRIPTSFGTKMRPYNPLLCTKFKGNRITRLCFMIDFVSVQKKGKKIRKKMKKMSQYLKAHISETPGAIDFKFGMWSSDGGEHLHSKMCSIL